MERGAVSAEASAEAGGKTFCKFTERFGEKISESLETRLDGAKHFFASGSVGDEWSEFVNHGDAR